MKLTLTVLVLIAGIGFGCGKDSDEETKRTTDITRAIEVATSALGASLDEFDVAATSTAFCTDRTASQMCTGSSGNFVKTVNYTSCIPTSGSGTLIGNNSLTYNDATTCQLDTAGDLLARTHNLTYTLTDGTQLVATSNAFTNYQSAIVSGGTIMSRSPALGAYQIQITGMTRKYMANNALTMSLSAKSQTTSNVQFSPTNNTLRNGRSVNGGTISVDHNTSQFTALLSPINLSWIAGCCHPQTGSINLTLSGTLSGSGTVVFSNSTCGSFNYSLTVSGQTTSGAGRLTQCGG